MYKVFFNEKELSVTNLPDNTKETIIFNSTESIISAISTLETTPCKNICIYHENIDLIWKTFTNLLINIPAAGGIVKNPENKILFIFRNGKWDFPKGKTEKGESLETSAIREVEEETGIKNIFIENYIAPTYHIYQHPENDKKILKTTHWFSMKYNETNNILFPQIEEGITKAEWKDKENIHKEVFQNTFMNIKFILEASQILSK